MQIIISQIKLNKKTKKFFNIINWIIPILSIIAFGFSINYFISKKIDLFTLIFFTIELFLVLIYTLFALKNYIIIKNKEITHKLLIASDIINLIVIIYLLINWLFLKNLFNIHQIVLLINLVLILLIFNSLLSNVEYK